MAYDYNAQIKRLTANPDFIYDEWQKAKGLFQFASPNGEFANCGCITMIHRGKDVVRINSIVDSDLTKLIRGDGRLPSYVAEIKPEHLPVFKEWQERLDEYRK